MKITAGMGTIEDFETLADAGADEIFCGFVPRFWTEKYGNVLAINRREVLFVHVQITTYEDMRILFEMSQKRGIPVSVTFNSLYYTPEQIYEVTDIIRNLIDIGFENFIVADINLIRHLSAENIPCSIHVSGEIGEWNSYTISMLLKEFSNDVTHISRIIFHRKNTFEDMKSCIEKARSWDENLEFEAFLMNEKCHYTGGFCNSIHSDEMVHMCQLEYRLPGIEYLNLKESPEDSVGASGCALCDIEKLISIGVTHFKIVGRGQSASLIARDIAAVLANDKTHCSQNCYYTSFRTSYPRA